MLKAMSDPTAASELERIEAQLADAWKNRDCTGWGALLADDWSVTHISADVITKAQAMEMCRTGPPVVSAVDQLAVRSYGDVAIVTGRTIASSTGDPPVSVRLRFTDVFVKRDGRWLVIASHATQMPD